MTLRGRTYEDPGKRVRAALVVLIGGVVLLLAALGMALLRVPSSEQQVVQVDRGESGPTEEGLVARTGVVLIAVGSVLLVTHDPAIETLAHRTILLEGGRIAGSDG